MSIRLRLTLWYSGLLAATLLVFGVSVYLFINWNTYNDLREQIQKHSEGMRITSIRILDTLDLNVIPGQRIEEKDVFVQLVNFQESKIRRSSNLISQNVFIPYPAAATNPQSGFEKRQLTIGNAKYPLLTYQEPIMDSRGGIVGLLQIGVMAYNEDKYLAGLRTTLIFSSLFVVLIAFTVGMLIARQALRPIDRVIQSTKQIEKGSDLSVRIPSEGPKDEIGVLVNTLNVMLSRLETAYNELDEAFKAQRRFVSDASHELRTPLTTIRGNIDLLEKMWSRAKETGNETEDVRIKAEHWNLSTEAMSDIAAEAKRMSTLVGDLLALARADAGYVMEKSSLALLPLTEEVVRKAGLLPRTAEWKIGDLSQLEGIYVTGSSDYIQQLLFIFIENAFKYTPSGSVELSAIRNNRHIGWIIKDTGIGMPEEHVPHIFDRFYRADESRGVTVGTGLGLSIAKWILDEHKGSIEVTTKVDEGSTFVIWLPIDFAEQEDSSIIKETDLNED